MGKLALDARYYGFVSCTLLLSLLVDGFKVSSWRKGIDRVGELVVCKMHLRVETLFIELICAFIRSTLLR